MSDFSLTLVLQIKTSKIINDMAKVQQKSKKISAFGGIFFVLDKFDRILSSVIDSHLGLRSRHYSRPLPRGSKSLSCLYFRPNSCFGKRFLETISVNLPKSVVLYKLFS